MCTEGTAANCPCFNSDICFRHFLKSNQYSEGAESQDRARARRSRMTETPLTPICISALKQSLVDREGVILRSFVKKGAPHGRTSVMMDHCIQSLITFMWKPAEMAQPPIQDDSLMACQAITSQWEARWKPLDCPGCDRSPEREGFPKSLLIPISPQILQFRSISTGLLQWNKCMRNSPLVGTSLGSELGWRDFFLLSPTMIYTKLEALCL